jgi:hypothetical protein
VAKPLGEADAWLQAYRDFWEGSFERLDDLLVELQPDKRPTKRGRHR